VTWPAEEMPNGYPITSPRLVGTRVLRPLLASARPDTVGLPEAPPGRDRSGSRLAAEPGGAEGPAEGTPGDEAGLAGKTCVKVDASTLAVAPFKGSTGIVSPPGILIVGGFGTDEAAPARVLEIMRAYGVDQVCYPGNRARPVLHELLVAAAAPSGPLPGETCDAPFDPNAIVTSQVNGFWIVQTPARATIGVFSDEPSAREYAGEISRLRFAQRCFVGQPKAIFRYLRK
jgi:hypothetical protein